MPTGSQPTSTHLNIIDSHKLLSVLADLGEQLHQIAVHSEALPSATKQHLLSQTDLSRTHTALGRLASLLSLPADSQVCPFTLAELGVCSTLDRNHSTGLRFYQKLSVPLEDLYDTTL